MLAPDRGLGTSYSYGDAHLCSPLIRKSGAEPFVARNEVFGYVRVGRTAPTTIYLFHLPLLAHPSDHIRSFPSPIHVSCIQPKALDEARSIARRPMAQSLKDEREEIVVRCHLAKGDADRAVAETAGHDNPGKCMHAFLVQWRRQWSAHVL